VTVLESYSNEHQY